MSAKLEIVMVDGTQGGSAPQTPQGAPVAPPVHQPPQPPRRTQDEGQGPSQPQPPNRDLSSVFDAVASKIGKAIPEVQAVKSINDVISNLQKLLESVGKAPRDAGRPTTAPQPQATQTSRPSAQTPQQPPQTTQPQRPSVQQQPSQPQPNRSTIQHDDLPSTRQPARRPGLPRVEPTKIPRRDPVPRPQPTSIPKRPGMPPIRPTAPRAPVARPVVAPPVQPAARAATGAAVRGGAAAGGARVAAMAPAVANPVGLTVAAVTVAFAGLAIATKKLSDKFSDVAKGIEDFSSPLLAANASREMNMMDAQIDRANALGPGLAPLESARGRIEEQMYRVQTDIYELLLRTFGPVLEMLLGGVEAGVASAGSMIKLGELLYAVLSTPFDQSDDKAAFQALQDSLANLKDTIDLNFGTDQNTPQQDLDILQVLSIGPSNSPSASPTPPSVNPWVP